MLFFCFYWNHFEIFIGISPVHVVRPLASLSMSRMFPFSCPSSNSYPLLLSLALTARVLLLGV